MITSFFNGNLHVTNTGQYLALTTHLPLMRHVQLCSFNSLTPEGAARLQVWCTFCPPKRHTKALFSSQASSNKAINNVIQNGGDLKQICDVFSGFFVVLHTEFQICLCWDIKLANFCTDIKELHRICFENRKDIN